MKSSWSSSELRLEFDRNASVSDELIDCLISCNPRKNEEIIIDLRSHLTNGDAFTIYPSNSNLFICDNEFIESCKNPIALFKYYEKKINYGRSPLTVTKNKNVLDIEKLKYSDESNQVYRMLLDTVILDVGSLKKDSIAIPPEIFSMLSEQTENRVSYCKYLSEFLSVLVISDRVIASDENLNNFEFQIFTKDNVKKFKYTWLDFESMKNGYWYTCYKWITSEDQKSVDIKVKRHIIREGITKYYNEDSIISFDDKKKTELIKIFDNTLRMIVSDKTQEYFETQKTLKAEYIDIYSKNFDSLSNVVNSILALFVALAAGLYGVLFSQGEVFDFFTPNKPVGVLLIVMLIAEVFVLVSSIFKLNSHSSYLEKLRKINAEKLMISDEDQDYLKNNSSGLVIFIFTILSILIGLTAGGTFWFLRP